MSESEPSTESRELLLHAAFVQRLARRLIRDRTAAEDLAQDVWVAALEHPPAGRREGTARAWLARVLRNQAAMRLRSRDRRTGREAAVARSVDVPDTTELVERAELSNQMVQATLALPEPYRDVLLRRFWREETPAQIAAHLGIPERTVRTRLRRGVERLRDRLRAGRDESPALFLAALTRLATDPPPSLVATLPPAAAGAGLSAGASLGAGLVSLLAMKKLLLGAAVAIAAVLFVTSRDGGPVSPGARDEVAHAPAQLAEVDAPAEPAPAPPQLVEASTARVGVEPSAPEPPAAAPAEETEPIDVDERLWLTFEVHDAHGNPVPGADVRMTQLRTRKNTGSSYGWFGGPSEATTDADGRARTWYPRWIDDRDDGPLETGAVGFTVMHSEYTTHRRWSHPVDETPARVTLERGALVVVSGWIDDPAEAIVDVRAELDDDVDVRAADWLPLADGRPSCANVAPGTHAVWLTHETSEGTWYSEVVPFELVEGEQKELHLRLVPARELRGVLDPRVPRPVRDGDVSLTLYHFDQETRVRVFRNRKAAVEADGTFVFPDLPPGHGEIIGICEGWSSRQAPPPPVEAGSGAQTRVLGAQYLQQVDPADHVERPFVLSMQPTGRVELRVLDADGEPLAGAKVTSWPNVHWKLGYAQIFLQRTWSARTDALGRAVLENLPEDGHVPFGVELEGYRLAEVTGPDGESLERERLAIASGETLRVEVTLEPRD